MKRYIPLAALALLTGCVTPQFTETMIRFESTPPGAKVTDGNGKVVCTTPCIADYRDDFGLISVYKFDATLAGYQPAHVEIAERHVFDARVPVDVVTFELKR